MCSCGQNNYKYAHVSRLHIMKTQPANRENKKLKKCLNINYYCSNKTQYSIKLIHLFVQRLKHSQNRFYFLFDKMRHDQRFDV